MAATPATLRDALLAAQAGGLDRLDAQLLLLHALGRSGNDRAWLLAHDGDSLDTVAAGAFETLAGRRRDGEPVAYLVGSKDFYGLELRVDSRVLVPRPDTETLVNWALDVSGDYPATAALRLLDLGTGSGAIALALADALHAGRPGAEVLAVDSSAEALAVARANAARLGLGVQFIESDWLEKVSGHFHLIVSNPPYIADGDSHLEALRHEPKQALTAGAEGLDDLRRIVDEAGAYLHAGGWLLLEHGYDQAPAVAGLLQNAGFTQVRHRKDLAGIARCSGGCWPGA